MKIVFFGTPQFSVSTLKALQNSGHEILAVVTQPDRQSGRGRRLATCAVKIEAEKIGLKVIQPLRARDTEFLGELKKLDPDLIVVVAYGQILPPEIIHLPKAGCVNIHASLLPEYRGASPINRAIIDGEEKTGITTMMMDEGMDTGPALLHAEIDILPEDTAGSLAEKLSGLGADLLLSTLEGIEKGTVKPVPQAGDPSYAPIMKKSDGLIDWSKPAREICNLIRGMNPWPGAYSYVGNERYKILKASILNDNAEAGIIDKVTKDELVIGTGSGKLSIIDIQPSGKPVMPVKAFLQGRDLKEGMKFTSNE